MTEEELENEIEAISKKMANAFVDNLSAEEYCELLERKLKLMHELFFKTHKGEN